MRCFETSKRKYVLNWASNLIQKAFKYENEEYIKTETLTAELNFEEKLEDGVAIAFDEVNTKLFIQKH